MSLPRSQGQGYGTPFGIDKRVDFGRQAASGTYHATIVMTPFFAVAAC